MGRVRLVQDEFLWVGKLIFPEFLKMREMPSPDELRHLEKPHTPWDTYTTPNKRVWKLPTSTQLRATWHTDSLFMVILPSTGTSHYHNCCIDGGTSPEYFGYHFVLSHSRSPNYFHTTQNIVDKFNTFLPISESLSARTVSMDITIVTFSSRTSAEVSAGSTRQ
jgi:hypothetical protein